MTRWTRSRSSVACSRVVSTPSRTVRLLGTKIFEPEAPKQLPRRAFSHAARSGFAAMPRAGWVEVISIHAVAHQVHGLAEAARLLANDAVQLPPLAY